MAITVSSQEQWRHKSRFGAENGLRASANSGSGFRLEQLDQTGGWMWGAGIVPVAAASSVSF